MIGSSRKGGQVPTMDPKPLLIKIMMNDKYND